METFSALMAKRAWNSPVTSDFPAQRPATRSFGVFFDLRLNKRLSKQLWGWLFGTPSRPLWRHCNVRSFRANFNDWLMTEVFLVKSSSGESLALADYKSPMVWEMTWCCPTASHYLGKCWPRFVSPCVYESNSVKKSYTFQIASMSQQ